MSAGTAQQAVRVQISLPLDDLRGHAGEEAVAHVADHPSAPRAQQPVVGAVGGGLVEPDADARVGFADLLDDGAHGGHCTAEPAAVVFGHSAQFSMWPARLLRGGVSLCRHLRRATVLRGPCTCHGPDGGAKGADDGPHVAVAALASGTAVTLTAG